MAAAVGGGVRLRRLAGLLIAALVPSLVHAHARLVSPAPRSPLIGKVAPCGGVAPTASPHVLATGQMLTVDWEETVDHPGYYRLLLSPAGDADFTVLLDDVPDRAFAPGAMQNDYSASVRLPSTPCEGCTLQLIQVMTENPPSPSYYYSCADVRLVDSSATTSTLPAAGGGTTTTTLAPDPCASLTGFAAVECRLTAALADRPCGEQVLPSDVQRIVERAIHAAEHRLVQARGRRRARQVNRFLALADGRLRAVERRTARAAKAGALEAGCGAAVHGAMESLRAMIAGLRAGG